MLQFRQLLECADFDQIHVGVGGQVGGVEHRATIGREAWVAVRVLVVEGAAVVGQDARTDVACTVPFEELDVRLGIAAEGATGRAVADDQRLVEAVKVG